MSEPATIVPLMRDSETVAVVRLGQAVGTTLRGQLLPGPEFGRYRKLFDEAVEAAKKVDQSSAENYQGNWQLWHESLSPIRKLNLTLGPERAEIEDLSIDSDWGVEFSLSIWPIVENEIRDTK